MTTDKKGKLILEDGTVFSGHLLSDKRATGEVVFNTSMTGYQESLTDPSYCRQLLTLTYPLVGNYGTAELFMQSGKSFVGGFIIGELCPTGESSNWHDEHSLAEFLRTQEVPCLYDVDTRAVTRHIRAAGTMKGVIVPEDAPQAEIDKLLAVPIRQDVVAEVTTKEVYTLEPLAADGRSAAGIAEAAAAGRGAEHGAAPHVACLDYGVKLNILRSMQAKGCRLTVFPAGATAEEVLAVNPDGIFLSNGPGDPADVPQAVETIKALLGKKPIFGICLGHQLLARALGAETYKLKFGHRGSNQPVKDLRTGKVAISSQNHGFAVKEASLSGLPLSVTHVNVNDGTVEGMHHTELPVYSVQYHPEASPGPDDNLYLFDEFIANMRGE